MTDPLHSLRATMRAAVEALGEGSAPGAEPTLERPPKEELGDYSTNAALLLAPVRGEPPRDVAELLQTELTERLRDTAKRIDVAGPGFINLFLDDSWYRRGVAAILSAGDAFASSLVEAPERHLIEFVSANPTGPLTAAGGRHAAYGDSVARVLDRAGHAVEREYYVNDVGGQVRRFAESIAARMRGEEPPEDGYEGEYIGELAERLSSERADPADLEALGLAGAEAMRERISSTLERFRVRFDIWFSERDLHRDERLSTAVATLRERGYVYEREGATWLRTGELGDDKDRVLVRSDGEPTYFAADIAYHRDKLDRGAERLIDVLGADHHGYVPRLRAALEALGIEAGRFEAVIMQLVHLVERGERAQMSKRKGEFVTLDELIADIGVDAARFFMLQRSHETTVDLDLELARRQSNDNPVYYVQYAHARIASILRKAGAEGGTNVEAATEASLSAPVDPSERVLVKRLLELPDEVLVGAERRAPHRLCAYATTTAADFHAFYRDCPVIGAGDGLEAARLGVCVATKRVIATTLELLGVSAPERM